jgi:UDP-N-acetylglucosamine 1-carboxyvinyltransferase
VIPVRTPTAARHAVAVRPSRPLGGVVRVDGSKNAALPLLAAAAAARRTVHLDNVPASADVQAMLGLLQRCGCNLGHSVSDHGSVVVMPGTAPIPLPDLADAARIRASYYLVPALLAACGQARLPWPGGCAIGERGMDQHFRVYEAFGDTVTLDESGYHVRAAARGPRQVMIDLPFRSRGASVAAILRAVVGDCQLLLGNPNLSPEVTGLMTALHQAGWQIEAAQDIAVVAPSSAAGSIAWTVPGDKVEAGTLACALAATGGNGRIEGVAGPDVATVVEVLNQLGIHATFEPGAITVHGGDSRLTGVPLRAVASLAPGGLDADFEPALIALALGMPGTHLFSDAINPGRHGNLLPQLARLGARIEGLSPTQCRLTGPQRLTGAPVQATDIRTGSALLIAALTARGTTTVTGLQQLRRGHADLPAKLRTLGADITGTETTR